MTSPQQPPITVVAATPEQIDKIIQATVVALKTEGSLLDFLNSDEWDPVETIRFFAGVTGLVSRAIRSEPLASPVPPEPSPEDTQRIDWLELHANQPGGLLLHDGRGVGAKRVRAPARLTGALVARGD